MANFTVVAYSESQDLGGAFGNVAAVADQSMRTNGDSIVIGDYNRFIGAMSVMGASNTLTRLVSPSLRRKAPHYVRNLNLGIVPGSPPLHDVDIGKKITLDTDEQLQVEALANPAAAEQGSVVVFLANGDLTVVDGEIFTVRAQITLAQLAGAWAFSDLDILDVLPAGSYDVVGFNPVIAGGVVARLIFSGQTNRPGAPCDQVLNAVENTRIFRNGYLGIWGTFDQNSPPAVEVLSSAAAASATYEVTLDLIKK